MKWTILIDEMNAKMTEEALDNGLTVTCGGEIVKVCWNIRKDIYGAPAALLVKGGLFDYLRSRRICKPTKQKIVKGWPDNTFRERPYM